MRQEKGEGVGRAARCRPIAWVGTWIVAAGLAGCGGGGGTETGNPPSSGGIPPSGGNTACTVANGTGSLRVKVTDVFGEAVPGAIVAWTRPGTGTFARAATDAAGVANLASLPACEGWVEVDHTVRGLGRSGDQAEPLSIRKDEVLVAPVRLEPIRQPAAAVVSASVGPGGVSADGRSLDLTLRIAVTGGREGESWLIGGAGAGASGVDAAPCQARLGTELAELGPRCIRGPDGSDRSYSFGRLNDLGVVRQVEGTPPPWSVGLLIDQSGAGLAQDWNGTMLHAPNDPRLFAARFLVDGLLPGVPLALAGFASDLAPGGASTLPQRPVTFFPVESPGFTTSRAAAFETLRDLSTMVGGGAPLHEAIAVAVDFMAARTPPGRKPMLVVLADGGDKDCGTPAQCSAARREIISRARAEGVELFLVGTDDAVACDYCLDIRAQEPLRSLAAEGGFPLVLSDEPWFDYCGAWGPCPLFAGALVSPLEMVAGWLLGTAQVQEVSIRLTSESPGAFAPGAVVMGELLGSNEDMCPWGDGYCWRYSLPFRVQVPD
jgi:hypothetical protein